MESAFPNSPDDPRYVVLDPERGYDVICADIDAAVQGGDLYGTAVWSRVYEVT